MTMKTGTYCQGKTHYLRKMDSLFRGNDDLKIEKPSGFFNVPQQAHA